MAQLAVMAVMFIGSAYKGAQQKKLKDQEAIAFTEARDRRMAAATREAAEEERNAEFMYSRALAVAGWQGGTQADAGINAMLADLAAEGEYRVLSTMWAGQNEAEGLSFRAEAARREGEAAYEAGIINGITSAVSGYFGMGGGNPLGNFSTSRQMELGLNAAARSTSASVIPRPSGFESSRWSY